MIAAWVLVVAEQIFDPSPKVMSKMGLGVKTSAHCLYSSAFDAVDRVSCIRFDLFARYYFTEQLGMQYSRFEFHRESYINGRDTHKEDRYYSHSLGLNYRFGTKRSATVSVAYGSRDETLSDRRQYPPQSVRYFHEKALGYRAEINFFQLSTPLSPEVSLGYLYLETGERKHFLTATVGMAFNVLYFDDSASR